MAVKKYLIQNVHLLILKEELFGAKQVFMYSVLDKHLLTDMGKTIVRKYACTTDAQSVWKDFQKPMKSSSKGDSEKEKINTVCNIWMTITKVQLNSLYCTLMSNSDSSKKFLIHLNIFLHKSNYSCCKMQ